MPSGFPVVVVEKGGAPFTQVMGNAPVATVTDNLGAPITLVEAGGAPLMLFNRDGTPYTGGGGSDVPANNRLSIKPLDNTPANFNQFGTWRGKSADFVIVFQGHVSWADYLGSIGFYVNRYSGLATPKLWAVALCIDTVTLSDGLGGAFDTYYTQAAQAILANAPASGQIIVRPGHEPQLPAPTYPWNANFTNTPAEYIAMFRRLVNCYRAVSPRFRFEWCLGWTSGSPPYFNNELCYPGDAYVDVVGMDYYYNSLYDNANARASFIFARDKDYGLAWQVAFAKAHRRALSLHEWGLNWDKPDWINLVANWLEKNKYAYSGYWNDTAAFNGILSDGSKPNAGDQFIRRFGTPSGAPAPMYTADFVDGVQGWAKTGGAVFSVTSGVASITNVANYSDLTQYVGAVVDYGKACVLSIDIHTGGLAGRVVVRDADAPAPVLVAQNFTTSSLSTRTLAFNAPESGQVIIQVLPYNGQAGQVVQFDNVRIDRA